MVFINSDLFLSVSERSLGTCCVNINAVARSVVLERRRPPRHPSSLCHAMAKYLKTKPENRPRAGFDHRSLGFQTTSLNEHFFYLPAKVSVLDCGARNRLSASQMVLIILFISRVMGCVFVVVFFQGVQAKERLGSISPS